MPVDRERSEAFGDDPDRYDRARPTYPDELVADLLAGNPRRVLDVGCGTGIASRLFQGDGRTVLGVEPDRRMAAVARRQGVEVESGRFEDWDPQGRRFDLIISGQAWHWVEPTVGPGKAAEILNPGGRIGVFWNHAQHGDRVTAVFEDVYRRHAPRLLEGDSVVLGRVTPRVQDPDAAALDATGSFDEIERRTYSWTRSYSVDSWLDELPTHSDHRFLDRVARAALFEDLAQELAALGDAIEVGYHTRLLTARRR